MSPSLPSTPPPPPQSPRATPPPETHSESDLALIATELLGGDPDGSIVLSALPKLLDEYERKYEVLLFGTGGRETISSCCEGQEQQIGRDMMLALLRMANPSSTSCPQSPTPRSSVPTSPFPDDTPRPEKRRQPSDRVRSASDTDTDMSSSNEDDSEEKRRKEANKHKRFSLGSGYALPAEPLEPSTKTMSESSTRSDSLHFRRPPSVSNSYNNIGMFARPLSASHLRRRSYNLASSVSVDDNLSNGDGPAHLPHKLYSVGRSASASYDLPLFQAASSRSASPSPMLDNASMPSYAIDHGAYHSGAKSPVSDIDMTDVHLAGALDPAEPDEFDLETVETAAIHLDRHHLAQLASETQDELRQLQKQNAELVRKLKEKETEFVHVGEDNERVIKDLTDQLDEAREDLQQHRHDEKSSKAKLQAKDLQISGLEAEIEQRKRVLEDNQRKLIHWQKTYNDQYDEANRRREQLLLREQEVKDLTEKLREKDADELQANNDIKVLKNRISVMAEDLETASKAQDILAEQKHENRELHETIVRLQHDLAKAQIHSSGGPQNPFGTPSANQTLTRNLGSEIARRLYEEESLTPAGERVREILTERVIERVVYPNTVGPMSPVSPRSLSEEPLLEEPDEDFSFEMRGDMSIPELILPPVTPTEEQEMAILQRFHPKESDKERDGKPAEDDDYNSLVHALGIRCEVLEKRIRMRMEEREKLGWRPPSKRPKRRPRAGDDSKPTSKDIRLTAVSAGLDPRDYQLFTHMNDIGAVVGFGAEGMPFGHHSMMGIMEQGVRMAAGIVPT